MIQGFRESRLIAEDQPTAINPERPSFLGKLSLGLDRINSLVNSVGDYLPSPREALTYGTTVMAAAGCALMLAEGTNATVTDCKPAPKSAKPRFSSLNVKHFSNFTPSNPEVGVPGVAIYADNVFVAGANRNMKVKITRSLVGVPSQSFKEAQTFTLKACDTRPKLAAFSPIKLIGEKNPPVPMPEAYRLVRIQEVKTNKNGKKVFIKITEKKFGGIVLP